MPDTTIRPEPTAAASAAGASADTRARLVRLIHVAKRELGLDDETYRALLHGSVRKESTSAMTVPELERVIDRMKRAGFKVRTKRPTSRQSRPLAQYPEAKKIRALWLFLYELGAVSDPSEAALASYVKRITKVDALQWLNGYQTEVVIETLKKWALRPRYLPDQVKTMAECLEGHIRDGCVHLTDAEVDDLRSLVGQAQKRQTFDPMQTAWEALKTTLDGEVT